MPVVRLSLSVSPELDRALRTAAKEQDTEVSRLAEALLRENPVIQRQIDALRGTTARTKRGRPLDKIRVLARAADAQWQERVRRGQVKYPGH